MIKAFWKLFICQMFHSKHHIVTPSCYSEKCLKCNREWIYDSHVWEDNL